MIKQEKKNKTDGFSKDAMKMYLYFDAVLGLDFMRCEDFRASLDRCFLCYTC